MEPKLSLKDAATLLGITPQGLNKKLKQKGINSKKGKNRKYLTHAESNQLFNIAFEKKIVAIQIVKGGAGKTALTSSLATALNLFGAKVLCVDLDQQANLSRAFGVKVERDTPVIIDVIEGRAEITEGILDVADGLHLFPSHIRNAVIDNTIVVERMSIDRVYSNLLKPLLGYYDYIFIDCPPALTHSVAAATLASDLVIAPVTPETGALDGLYLTVEEFGKLERHYKKKIDIKIVQNRFDARTNLSHAILQELLKEPKFSGSMFRTYIRSTQDFPNCYTKSQSIFDQLKPSVAKEDIQMLAREILDLYSASVLNESEKVLKKAEPVL